MGSTTSSTALRVALVAEESVGASTLRLLLSRGHDVACVVSAGRGLGSPVVQLAEQHRLSVRPPADVRSTAFAAWLHEQEVDLLLNVHSLAIAAGEVVQAPRLGSYNLHPGPLPQYAGLNVPSWAVLHGERQHGATLHRMTATVDAGAVAYASSFAVGEHDTALAVFSRCLRSGLGLVEELLTTLERGAPVPAHAQDPVQRRWFDAGPPDGGRLDWNRPAREVLALVRACDYGPFRSPWGHPRCGSESGQVQVVRASATGWPADVPAGTVGPVGQDGALVATADAWVLVQQLLLDGRRCPAREALRPGLVLGNEVARA